MREFSKDTNLESSDYESIKVLKIYLVIAFVFVLNFLVHLSFFQTQQNSRRFSLRFFFN